MKVIVTKRGDERFDCRIRRTRRNEGDNVSAKDLTRDELHSYVAREVEAISPISLPMS